MKEVFPAAGQPPPVCRSFVARRGALRCLLAGAARAADDPSNLLYMQLKDGMVVIRMRPDLAPKTCRADQDPGEARLL